MQLPEVVLRTCLAYISTANMASAGYLFLTLGAGRGKLLPPQAARFYIERESPEIDAQIQLLTSGNGMPFEMDENWF